MPRIVIVEDSPSNMRLASLLLRSAGHRVLRATDAEAGLALVRAKLPALVLMDIQLPGMDGLEAVRQIKADPALTHVKVIAVSANAMAGRAEAARQAGCDAFLAKPFRQHALVQTVHRVLGAPTCTVIGPAPDVETAC